MTVEHATVPKRVAPKQSDESSQREAGVTVECATVPKRAVPKHKRQVRNQNNKANEAAREERQTKGVSRQAECHTKRRWHGRQSCSGESPVRRKTKQHMRGRLKPAPGSWEQAHTKPHRGAANVEVRWNKRCVSRLAQSCRQGNRLCKSSPDCFV